MTQGVDQPMSSKTPYLIRAMYEWIVDNGMTPHLMVDANVDGVEVPGQYVEDGKIVLNVSPASTRGLELGNDFILFGARFSGVAMDITVPVRAVRAIYARENNKGLMFEPEFDERGPDEPSTPPERPSPEPGGSKPSLRVVK